MIFSVMQFLSWQTIRRPAFYRSLPSTCFCSLQLNLESTVVMCDDKNEAEPILTGNFCDVFLVPDVNEI